LPTGYQAIAGQGKDKTAIRFAALVEKAFGGFTPPKGYD
jgi:amidase